MIKIEDNFLDQKDLDVMLPHSSEGPGGVGDGWAWIYNDAIDYEGEEGKFQFVHPFYGNCVPCSPNMEFLDSIIGKINPLAIYRIKANLLTKTPNIVKNEFHIDMGGFEDCLEKLNYWTTSIFYMNTNNGYTEFEDGTKVESVANRIVSFPSKMKHRGTSCTDAKIRMVINFNYFKSP